MTDLLKKFLTDDVKRLSPGGRFVGLAAFGKHPGWDDHVEDLGLETDSLNQAKSVFYVNGIGGQIDSGAWEKTDASQQLPGFNHLFLWQRSGQILLGRLWSSSDGKGRKRYPMVVCFHFVGVSLRSALSSGLPALAELEQQIQSTSVAEDVRSILNRKRAALRESLPSAENGGEYAPLSPDKIASILQSSEDGSSVGFMRVLYQMHSQFKTFALGTFNPRARGPTARSQQIRVPAASQNPEEAFLFWTRFFLAQIDPSVPLLFCLPLEGSWMDVTAGDPESHEFFSLRASPKAVPLVSEVPYTLEDSFKSQARSFLAAFEKGDSHPPVFSGTDTVPATAGSNTGRSGWLKWLGVGVVLLAAGIGAFLYFGKSGKCDPVAQTVSSAPVSTNASVNTTAAAAPVAQPPTPAVSTETPKAAPSEASNVSTRVFAPKSSEPAALISNPQSTVGAAAVSDAAIVTQAVAVIKSNASVAAGSPTTSETVTSAIPDTASLQKESEAGIAPAKTVAFAGSPATGNPHLPAEPAAAPALNPGTVMTNSIGMVLVLMPSGFWTGKYEVTRAEYSRIVGGAVSDDRSAALPANRVSWDEAKTFCSKLSDLESGRFKGKTYALPTLKQWEEIRAGQKLEELPAGALKTASQEPAAVSDTISNKLGLYGVLGNVWEWCLDGGNENAKLQKGGEYNNTSYERLVVGGKARLNSGFRIVLVQQ